MPTLFARIDAGLEGNDVSLRLTAQVNHLTAVATTVAGFIHNPPQGINDLLRFLRELPLPDIRVGGDLAATLGRLQQTVPTDLSSVTGVLATGLQQLQTDVETEVLAVLREAIEAALAIHQLTQTDVFCADAGSSGSGEAGENGASGDAENGTGSGDGGPSGSSGPPTPAAINQANAALDRLPSPLNVETFLAWLHQGTDIPARDAMIPILLPVVDDLRDPLDTLLTWRTMDAAQIRSHLADTLSHVEAFIRAGVDSALSPLVADLNRIASSLPTTALTRIADRLTMQLGELRMAIAAGDLSGAGPTVAAMNALLDEYEAVRSTLHADVLGELTALTERLNLLPGDLEAGMGHVVSALRPNGSLGQISELFVSLPESPNADETSAALEDRGTALADWLRGLLDQIDLAAVQEAMETAVSGARSLVNSLDESLVTVTLEAQNLFGEAEALLNQVDTEAIAQQVEAAIEQFKSELIQQLRALFTPVRDVIGQVITRISQGVDAFNPEDIIEGLRQAIQTLTGILQDPAVIATVNEVRDALDAVTQQLTALSFAPLTDQVIASIEEVTETLRDIDTSKLDTALQLALQAALAVLPEDLTPITNSLVDEFGELMDSGPIPLLEAVRPQPQRLLDQVRRFEPAALVGDALTQPYHMLLTQMQAFQPSQLLMPVQQELNNLKDRLKANINPGRALEPLERPFDELMEAFDRLSPGELVRPLEEVIADLINQLLEAVPTDEVFGQIDTALKRVERAIGIGDGVVVLLRRVRDLLEGFANAPRQLDAWLDSILDQVESVDTGSLQPLLMSLSQALDDTRAAALMGRLGEMLNPLLAALEGLNGQARLTALIQAYRGISRSALSVLPDTPEKTAVIAALDRFNPTQPAFGAPYRALAAWRQELAQTQAALQAALADWDARYHSDGVLTGFRQPSVTGAQLRQWIEEALDPQFTRPVKALFVLVEPVRLTIGTLVAQLESLMSLLKDRLANLLSGPNSLGAIRDMLQELIQRLRDFNLSFLIEGLNELFIQVRNKLEALSPAHLRQIVEQAFNEMLDTLDVSQLLPVADLAQLDADYIAIVNKLKALDPTKLVIQVVQPEFEQAVIPLLETFDLTPLLDALVERSRALEDELRAGLDQVNNAFRAMRQAVPAMSLSLGLEVDVGISF
ncbi:MAG: hypothetical protein RML36_09215 [Anaerolineae bacterium]|nr:hypothetical protein [Anaerolineae bacterium]MDW8099645.1 hypothetical protein [Anaerolineae bacterium]